MVIDFRVRPPYKSFLETGIIKGYQNLPVDRRQRSALNMFREEVPSVDKADVDLMLREMDEAHVSQIVAMGRRTGVSAAGFGNMDNQDVLELAKRYSGRIIPFAGINPHDEDCGEQTEKALAGGFRGISIDAGWCTPALQVDDPLLDPILSVASEMGGIVSLTMSAVLGPDMSYCKPVTLQHVARKYPNLKIVVPHAAWPYINEVLCAAMFCRNIYLCPDCYFYCPGIPGTKELVDAANTWLKHRLLFASSYPITGFKQSIALWSSKGLSADALLYSLYDNAAELLGL